MAHRPQVASPWVRLLLLEPSLPAPESFIGLCSTDGWARPVGLGLPRDPGRPSMRTCNKLAGQAAVLLQEPPFAHGWVRLTSFLSVLAGTFITEWKEGGRLCEAFLAGDESSYRAVADQLVLIAQFFRFDGWLINIENSLSVSIAFSWCLPGPALLPPCPSAAALCGLAGAG